MPRSSPPTSLLIEPHHDPAQVKRVRDRLRRAEGQVRGVQRMLDENRPCEEIVTQLLAARSALDQVIRQVLSEQVADASQRFHLTRPAPRSRAQWRCFCVPETKIGASPCHFSAKPTRTS
jgi:DNA-binding FrmR family transcriptional regulator